MSKKHFSYTKEKLENIKKFLDENIDKISSKDIANHFGYTPEQVRGLLSYFKFSLKEFKKKKIKELVDLGFSNSEIAKMIGYKYDTAVSAFKRRNNLKKRKKSARKYINKEIVKKYLINCNFKITCVEKKYHISKKMFKKLMIKYGLYDWAIENGFTPKEKNGHKKELILKFLKTNPNLTGTQIARKINKILGENYISERYARKIVWLERNKNESNN